MHFHFDLTGVPPLFYEWILPLPKLGTYILSRYLLTGEVYFSGRGIAASSIKLLRQSPSLEVLSLLDIDAIQVTSNEFALRTIHLLQVLSC